MIGVSGFWLAAFHYHHYPVGGLIGLVLGLSLVIASDCTFNNYIDRGIDAKMSRTKKRALVTHKIGRAAALIYATALGAAGFIVLALLTNWSVVWLNLAAILSYVIVYGWAKRNTVHGTLVGTVPGAIPPAAGYAVIGPLDGGALLFFLVLVFWQMPHFYAIAMYRYKDYKAAGLPVMPVRHGMKTTRIQIVIYIVLLAAACAALTAFGYDGYIFLAAAVALCAYWLARALKQYGLPDEEWGKVMFFISLFVLPALAVLIPLGAVLA
jgi:protoheme IX farnesyltransferase